MTDIANPGGCVGVGGCGRVWVWVSGWEPTYPFQYPPTPTPCTQLGPSSPYLWLGVAHGVAHAVLDAVT